MKLPKQSTVLKFSSVAIGSPRYMGAFGALVGVDAIELIPWLIYAEIYSGLAMGLLEGFAIAYVFGKLSLLVVGSPEYKRLHIYGWLAIVTLPIVALPYLLAAQRGLDISSLFALDVLAGATGSSPLVLVGLTLQALWSLVALAVPVLTLMAVGYADFSPTGAKKLALEQDTELTNFALEQKQVVLAQKQVVLEQATELKKSKVKPYQCPGCKKPFAKKKGVDGHQANCPSRASGLLNKNGAVK